MEKKDAHEQESSFNIDAETVEMLKNLKAEREYDTIKDAFFKDEEKKLLQPFYEELKDDFAKTPEGFTNAMIAAQALFKHANKKEDKKEPEKVVDEKGDKTDVATGGVKLNRTGGTVKPDIKKPIDKVEFDVKDNTKMKEYFKSKGFDETKLSFLDRNINVFI